MIKKRAFNNWLIWSNFSAQIYLPPDPSNSAGSLEQIRKLSTRQNPLYYNCFLQAPDGELLCTCDKKKALWYISKGIGELILEDPLTVRLKFEPAGRAVGATGKYYQKVKENQCVVCGNSESYSRKNVVPREYRKCFPCKLCTVRKEMVNLPFFFECVISRNVRKVG